jgi:hypothetical protein
MKRTLIKAAQCAGILGVLLHSFAMPVYAADHQRPPRDDHHAGPPQEAILACKGLSGNDVCSFAGRNDELIHGTCSLPPRADDAATLACKPDNMPEPPEGNAGGREPPPDRAD